MPTLPAHPNLDQLRRQAKDLLRDAVTGDTRALERINIVSDELTLAAAQLALAREYGFPSWPALMHDVEARVRSLNDTVDAFLEASVGFRIGRAVRMLAETPEIAEHGIATALILGDERRVRDAFDRDPSLVRSRDPRSGWSALHAVCASRWHVDPDRAVGLFAIAKLLIERGVDMHERTTQGGWWPLRCAVISAASSMNNEPIMRLLLEHGATPDDDCLYNAGFAADPPRLLRLLIEHGADIPGLAEQALAAPISAHDTEAVRVLLDAGADPRRYRDDDGRAAAVVLAAVVAGCDLDLIELLLTHGADPDATGPDGRSPVRLATAEGRPELVELLRRSGARDDSSDLDRLLDACRRRDREGAERLLAERPRLLRELSAEDSAAAASALVGTAEAGDAEAVRLMLDVGFSIESRGDEGATALHASGYAGSAETVQALLARNADLEARDTTWDSPPLEWAIVGSGERLSRAPAPDWVATVALLLDAGASTDWITLSPDDQKSPSEDVAQLLRERGVA